MKPILLMILDGWGWREERQGNAITLARTPNWDGFLKRWPHTTLESSGIAVGLPVGAMGNSEVGHLNIGAGRVVYQEYTRINKAIDDGTFFKNDVLKNVFVRLKSQNGALHLMGLCSDAGVHSHLNHLYALIDFALWKDVRRIFIHCFTDGRDSPPDSGIKYIKQIEERLSNFKVKIVTIMGRYYAMDRDKRWDRTNKAYEAIVNGVGRYASSAALAVETSYKEGITDEFITPTVIEKDGHLIATVRDGDAVVFFNFRADRARQLTHTMMDKKLRLSALVTMTQYDERFALPVMFLPERLANTFGEVIANHGLSQLRIAETEKYAHVTYFFNGGEEKVFPSEDRVLIPSPRDVPTYDKKPQMSAYEVTGEVIKRIESGRYDVIILNYANPDMVGHTGVLKAAIKAVEAVDECMGKVVDAVMGAGGATLITADHGNCESMTDEHGKPQTAHTINLVPFILIGKGMERARLHADGILSDIAPTILELLRLAKPVEMTGRSLVITM